MNMKPVGKVLRWPGRLRQSAVRHPVRALLLFAALAGVLAGTVLLADRSTAGGSLLKIGQIVLLLLLPALLFEATFQVPRGVRAVRRLVETRRAERNPQPLGPPIEKIAADLRRLLWQHDRFARSDDIPMRALRLRALEAAITDCATQAARALDVPHPDRPGRDGYGRPQLRRLLLALVAAGLVLPAAVRLLAPDNHF
jgi:hypothetical protein